jgi:hypothetical protein
VIVCEGEENVFPMCAPFQTSIISAKTVSTDAASAFCRHGPLPFSPSPRLRQEPARGGSSARPRAATACPPAIAFPSGRGCSAPSDPPARSGRRERSSLGATEIPMLYGEGASSTASTTEEGEGELRPLSAWARSRGVAPCRRRRAPRRLLPCRRRPPSPSPSPDPATRGASRAAGEADPRSATAPWRSEVGHGATVFFPTATSPPPLPPRAGANGQGSMQQLLRDAAGGTPPPCLHPLSLFLNQRCRPGICWRRSKVLTLCVCRKPESNEFANLVMKGMG